MHTATLQRLYHIKHAALLILREEMHDESIPLEDLKADALLFNAEWFHQLDDLIKGELVARHILPADYVERARKLRQDARANARDTLKSV
jgi:hypothetical protein